MDIDYTPAISIVDAPISDPIHAPCEDMAGCANFDPEKCENSARKVEELRSKFGFNRSRSRKLNVNPLTWKKR
ncbi:hypothetical protein [Vibrio barjaei]|uniref:hypothetical protein n=1 Tax=Vibrio barjaei TaxID=1676683 RepID=UPI0007BAE484|nr:hypothetical protein [Vibrio barjaei]